MPSEVRMVNGTYIEPQGRGDQLSHHKLLTLQCRNGNKGGLLMRRWNGRGKERLAAYLKMLFQDRLHELDSRYASLSNRAYVCWRAAQFSRDIFYGIQRWSHCE